MSELAFTGEYFVPGKSPKRIADDHLERYRFAARFVSGKRVLDVACGAGYGSEILMAAGALSYQGADINPMLVEHGSKTYAAPDVSFRVGDVTALGFKEEFDAITSFETIEHVPDYQAAIRNLFDALRPGGIMLISSPDRRITSPRARSLSCKPGNKFHTQEFIPSELVDELTRAGFSVGDGDVYGQRLRPFPRVGLVGRVAHFFMPSPEENASPVPQPVGRSFARYFIVNAKKPSR